MTSRIMNSFSHDLNLLKLVLVVGHPPLQLLAGLPRLLQLSLIQVTAAARS